ncbi:MAG: hypothetical protein H6604_01740 [Flavobacteriales bacterium]|nr:hypothetical protein [Flavobacteriales bacterium]
MKFNIVFLGGIIAIISLFSSCSNMKSISDNKFIDKRLVGEWEGEESGQQIEGIIKKWKVIRDKNGNYDMQFTIIKGDGKSTTSHENGSWWIEDDKFKEQYEKSDIPEVYKYTVLNKNQIQFELLSSEMNFDSGNYIFIDNRVAKSNKDVKDGMSIQSAIKVKGISEEYEYVYSRCNGCKVVKQTLIHEGNKHYDVLTVQNFNETEVEYYFDISSFFGKNFSF